MGTDSRKRSVIKAVMLFAAGAAVGYGAAYATGAPMPDFVTALRFDIHAALDEARLRAAARSSQRVLSHTAMTIGRGGTVAAGLTLAEAIRLSRQQALRSRSHPIDDEMKALFRPYFPEEVLETTRWTLSDRRVGLGSILAGWYYREGAVTLGDVIVFSNPAAARHRALVAHELTHVVQYRQLGVGDFARLYVHEWPLLEGQARRNAGRILADIDRRPALGD